MTKTVLALDLAKTTGFACDGPDIVPPVTGTYTIFVPNEVRGPGFLKFNEWLYDAVGLFGADLIAYEAPITQGGKHDRHEAILLIGLAAQVEMIAAAHGLPVVSPAINTIRAHFVNNGYPPNPKQAVLGKCRELGWETGGDDNRADAAALWDYTKSKFDKKNYSAVATSPLFANGRTG